jgi:hypothetical protein
VTQKSNTTTKFYCTEHVQNPSHPTDKCYTLKNRAEKARGALSSGLTKKSFRKEINILAKGRPRKKVLEMFAVVLQQEHNKLAAKTPKKAKKTEIIIDKSTQRWDVANMVTDTSPYPSPYLPRSHDVPLKASFSGLFCLHVILSASPIRLI